MDIGAILKRMMMRGGFTLWSIFPNLMLTSDPGLCMIQQFEGCRLESYQDPGKVWTIGFGHTHGVKKNQKITLKQAHEFFLQDVSLVERDVLSCVKVELNLNEFSSLVCFTYNVGSGALKTSTLLKLLNRNEKQFAAQEFLRWKNINGVPNLGLLRRREAERKLFLMPIDLKSRSQ